MTDADLCHLTDWFENVYKMRYWAGWFWYELFGTPYQQVFSRRGPYISRNCNSKVK